MPRFLPAARRSFRRHPRATDALVISPGLHDPWLHWVHFAGTPLPHGDSDRETYLRFRDLGDWIDLANIVVEPRLRRQGVAERMVREVARAYPGVRLMFTGMNEQSRRLARRLSATLPHFDPDTENQTRNLAADTTAGYYGPEWPPDLSFEEWTRLYAPRLALRVIAREVGRGGPGPPP